MTTIGFGVPNAENLGKPQGEYLSRIQYDARTGFWTIVKRTQHSDGSWGWEEGDPFRNATLLMDFGSIEGGWIKLSKPPVYVVVPFGQDEPRRPEEGPQTANDPDSRRFRRGFRCKVANPKLFGDADAYYFTNSAVTVLEPYRDLWADFTVAPQAARGMVPVVACSGTKAIISGRQGTKFHAPVLSITGWRERPICFGERTVPAPGANPAGMMGVTTGPQKPATAKAPAAAVQAPEPPPNDDEWGTQAAGPADRQAPQAQARVPMPAGDIDDDMIPF